jgi:hypothetical protein
VGFSSSPDLASIIELIGIEKCCRRNEKAINNIAT